MNPPHIYNTLVEPGVRRLHRTKSRKKNTFYSHKIFTTRNAKKLIFFFTTQLSYSLLPLTHLLRLTHHSRSLHTCEGRPLSLSIIVYPLGTFLFQFVNKAFQLYNSFFTSRLVSRYKIRQGNSR